VGRVCFFRKERKGSAISMHGAFWCHNRSVGTVRTMSRAQRAPPLKGGFLCCGGKPDILPVMRQPARKRKKLDYPEVTNGTHWAAEARRLASKLTPEQEAEDFRRAIAK